MPLTSEDVRQQKFGASRYGYAPDEVDAFLDKLATEIDYFNNALLEAKSCDEASEDRVRAVEIRVQAIEQKLALLATRSSLASELATRSSLASELGGSYY